MPSTAGALTWKAVGRLVDGGTAVQVTTTDSGAIGLMWMDPSKLSFRYIPGYQFPEKSPRMAQDKQPATWLPGLTAAFNGAFHLHDNAGGYYYDGTIVRPLRAGLASIVTGLDGSMHVVVWADYMTPQPGTLAIRQNLPPLVSSGVSQATPHDGNAKWGLANDGLPHANRSALGETADGALVFAYGHEVTADAMASAMVQAGVQTAVTLDMNKSWPTGYFYDAPSTTTSAPTSSVPKPVGHRIQAGIQRDPSTYFAPFKKDFFVAIARDFAAQTPLVSPTPSLP
jgi:Phosphodiester glycosidase